MKAQVLHSTGPIARHPLQLRDLPIPIPKPGQLRIRVSVCGVCHTDLHTVEGDLDLPGSPVIPGHQVVGTVDELGENVQGFQLGDRVGVAWLHETCGICEFCINGLENLCTKARFTGLHKPGGYADYLISVPEFTFPIPSVFSDAEASPLLCAGIIGFRSLKSCQIAEGQNLGLFGFGASAHLAIQVARYWNCKVFVFTRSPEHQEHALELGAHWVGSPQDAPPELLHAAITFVPVGWIIPVALSRIKPGGTLAINAVHLSPIPEMEYPLIYGERCIKSVANFTREDAHSFLNLAARIPIRTEVKTYPLEQANQVLVKLKNSEIKGAAALIPTNPEAGPA